MANNTKYFSFRLDFQSLKVEFVCSCGAKVESVEIELPIPDYSAETNKKSTKEVQSIKICENCNKNFEIILYAGYAGGQCEIIGIENNQRTKTHFTFRANFNGYELGAILNNTDFKITFDESIGKIKKLNELELDDEELNTLLKNNILVSVITTMETYLSDAFINIIDKGDEKFIRAFVNCSEKKYKKSFKLKTTFSDSEKTKIINDLKEFTFHNIWIAKKYYEGVLNVDFPKDLSFLKEYIESRHDVVHRNSKTKEGATVKLPKLDIEYAINEAIEFIEFIDEQIKRIL